MFKSFPHYRRHDTKDCGPTCLQIIALYYASGIPCKRFANARSSPAKGCRCWASAMRRRALASEPWGTAKVIIKERTLLECFLKR